MTNQSRRYHSLSIGNKNTWDDWHLVPTSRPVVPPPGVKTKILDIPGGDGIIDLSESLTGYPVYENRSFSQEFVVVNDFYEPVDTHKEWYSTYSDIMDYLHGQRMQMLLDDDMEYYYEGRFAVNSWKSGSKISSITINASLGPYKWARRLTTDSDWVWDTFNFETGIIFSSVFKNISVNTVTKTIQLSERLIGRAPVCPTFVVSNAANGIQVREGTSGDWTTLQNGSHQISSIIFHGTATTIQVKTPSGTGTVSIQFRQGRL